MNLRYSIKSLRIFLLAVCLFQGARLQAANIISVLPTANAIHVSAGENIVVTFDATIPAASVSIATFQVKGSQSGLLAGTFTGGGTNTIIFNPARLFMSGEVVTVTLTTGIGLTTPHSWQFTSVSDAVITPSEFNPSFKISTTANGVQSVYAADVDSDGDADVLSATFFTGTITWYENDGAGSFTPHTITTSLAVALDVYAADLDSDGDMDVLSASRDDNKIAWYENDGAENFTTHVITTTANGAISVYAADVDSDGDMDVLSASATDNKIAWYENNGASVFTAHTITTTALTAQAVYAADVDKDGDMDVLSASSFDNTIAWYENNGAQVFTLRVISNTAQGATDVYAGDLDEDGDMDILSALGGEDKIVWYENNGAQVFTMHVISTTPDTPRSILMADLNGDGNLDVAAASSWDDRITWWENIGMSVSTVFAEHTITMEARSAYSICAADIDGDLDLDIVAATSGNREVVWYQHNSVDPPTPTAHVVAVAPNISAQQVAASSDIVVTFDVAIPAAAADPANFIVHGAQSGRAEGVFTGGGTNTLTFNPTGNFYAGEVVTVSLTSGLGLQPSGYTWQFTVASSAVVPAFVNIPALSTTENQAYEVYPVDLDSDGDMDLLSVALSNKIAWYENDGTPTLIRHQIFTAGASAPTSIRAADMDADGDVDIVVTSHDDSRILLLENDGAQAFTSRLLGNGINAMVIHLADMNGDGDLDVLAGGSGKIILYNNNAGVFIPQTITTRIKDVNSLHAADMDGDGDLDIISSAYDQFTLNDGWITWYENTQSPEFTTHLILTTTDDPTWVYATDLDSDGDMDVVSSGSTMNSIFWHENNGSQTFTTHTVTLTEGSGRAVQAADIDGDGDMDLVGWKSSTKQVMWYENNGAETFTGHPVAPGVDYMMTIYAADVDNDGDMDVMTASLNDNRIAWFPNNLPPAIADAVANQTTDDYTPIPPFTALVTTDRDNGQRLSVSVQVDVAAKGGFTAASLIASGFVNAGGGNYTFSGTAAAAQVALRLLVFAPTTGRMPVGSSETVVLTVTANDAISPAVTDNITTIIVTAIAPPTVNLPPSFTLTSALIEIDEDSPLASMPGFATSISAGSASESSQSLNFVVSNDNMALFSTQPAIDPTGTLTYQVAANAWGSATVTVILHDDGGTAHGGVDQSAPVTFVIQVNPVNDAPFADAVDNITLPSGEQAELTLTGLHPGPFEDSQHLTVTASSGAPLLLGNPTVTLHDDGTATLVLTPVAGAAGTITVTVVIRDDGGTLRGGDDETVITFTVTLDDYTGPQTVFLPTLFSPNSDGSNDVFRVRGAEISEIRFSVYSADGHEVFRTTDINEATERGWDGRYHGRDMPAGTYTWTLQGHFTNGDPLLPGKHGYGQVMLLR